MARRVKGPPPGTEEWYTPTALGNDKEPEGDRVRVKIRYPTEGDKRRLASATVRGADDPKALIEDEAAQASYVEVYTLALLNAFVLEIADYEDGGGNPIDTPKLFYEHGDKEIVRDVIEEVGSGLSLRPDEKKDSKESPASPPTTRPPSDGTAGSASKPRPTPRGDAEVPSTAS